VNAETHIKNACGDLSAQARVPADLTDRVLSADRAPRARARRPLKYSLAAGATALLVGAGAAVAVTGGSAPKPPTPTPTIQPVTLSSDTTLRTDLGSTFPRHLVAAGHTAVAAYFTAHKGASGIERTYYLFDPSSGTYEKTPWAFLDVAPGMHQAAVIEGPLPAPRVGILDMATRKVTRWVSIGHKVGGVAWAPDGRRLLLTAYDKNPDMIDPGPRFGPEGPSGSRTGFAVVDTATGHGTFHALAPYPGAPGTRQDFGWSRNGTLIWAPTETDPEKVFYDLNGRPQPAPAHEADGMEEAGLSPNGALQPKFGPNPGPAVTITNVKTGKTAAILPIEQARAWADDRQLFAVGCALKKCTGTGEFHNRLLLVNLQGKVTPLTGYHRSDKLGSWVPLFTHR
jgi:hypothetical protein